MTRDARLSALHRGGFGLRGRASLTGIGAGSVTASSWDAAPEQAGGRARGALRYAFTSHACGGNARRAASTERARCIGFRQRDFGCAGASTQPRAAADVARRHHADRRGLVDFACADARAGGRRRGRHQRWFCERWLRRKRLQWNCGGPRDLCQRLWWRWRRWWRGRR